MVFSSLRNNAALIAVGAFITLLTAALLGFSGLYSRWWLQGILVLILLAGFHFLRPISAIWRATILGFALGLVLIYGYFNLTIAYDNIVTPKEWDFLAFWLDGQVGAQAVNFYESSHYYAAAAGLSQPLSDEFVVEVLDLAFRYPPPTMLLLLPLGWFEVQPAALLWHGLLFVVLVVDIALLWRGVLKSRALSDLLLVAALVMIFKATANTLFSSQTIFVLLLFMTLFWIRRHHRDAGVWLMLAVVVKPLIVIMGLYLLFHRQWRTILTILVSFVVLSLIATVLFGLDIYPTYIFNNPTTSLPDFLYTESVNQSLLAFILRTTGTAAAAQAVYLNPIFLLLAGLLVAATAFLIARLPEDDSETAIWLNLLLALLIYPATLVHYSFLLLLPLLFIWQKRQSFAGGVWGAFFFIVFVYSLAAYGQGETVFLANALCWCVLAAGAVANLRKNWHTLRLSHTSA